MPSLNIFKIKCLLPLLVAGFTCLVSEAQISPLQLRTGQLMPAQSSLRGLDPASSIYSNSTYHDRLFIILQCKRLLDENDRKKLDQLGIKLLEYIPDKSYLVEVTRPVTELTLRSFYIHNIVPLQPNFKLLPVLMETAGRSLVQEGTDLKVKVIGFPGISDLELEGVLEKAKIKIEKSTIPGGGGLKATVSPLQLLEIVKLPSVYFVEEDFGTDSILNEESNVLTGTSFIQNDIPGIGKGLTGKGVVIGMGDNGGASHHLDHFYKTLEAVPSMVYHSTHVAGIIGGAGLINPRIKGRAPGASLIVSGFSDITVAAAQYYQQFGMVLTNNSYGGNGRPCDTYGAYNSSSREIDRLSINFPEVTHVYAAGNQSTSNCAPYPPGYLTVYQGPQSAKNTITVGATQKFNYVNPLSKGPTYDGRIKPEITAIGVNVMSTVPPNIYSTNTGTSMAAPQVTGSLALLIERYRQLNNGRNPLSGLLKNIILNSTTDIGASGPDFASGYGWLDARTAMDLLETENYFSQTISNGQEQSRSISVGANVSELKVMLSWPDVPGSLYSMKTLVNDLDIIVKSPSGQIIKPLILDPKSALNTAIPGVDHTNCVEQIIIRDPLPGVYTISVAGYEIPLGPQSYFVSYNLVRKGLNLLSPLKYDKLKQGETVLISWSDPGSNPIGYGLEFSPDGGITWQNIGSVDGTTKYFQFTVPPLTILNSMFRVRNRSTAEEVVADSVCVFPEMNFSVTSPCSGMVEVRWQKPTGVDSVSVLMVESGRMKGIITSSDSSFLVKGLSVDSTYWFSVRPYSQSISGERAIAKSVQAIGGNCLLPDFDGDIALLSILNPTGARKNTSSEKTNAEKIVIKIVNKDNEPITEPIVVQSFVNNILFSKDTITSTIPGYAEYSFTLGKTIDLSAVGNYSIRVELILSSDPDPSNNSLTSRVRIVANPPITLPMEDDFETLYDTVYRFPSYFALEGKDNWDISISNNTGFLKTRVSPGNKALLPGKLPQRPLNVNFDMVGTYNLSGYSTDEDLFLAVNTKHKVITGTGWIRGSDSSSWINLPFSESAPYASGNLSRALKSANQKLTSSFQIRFEQVKTSVEFDKPDTLNYFDDLKIYKVMDDVKVASVRSNASRFFNGDTAVITAIVTSNVGNTINKVPILISCGSFTLVDTVEIINAYDTSVRVYRIPISRIERLGSILLQAKTVLATDTQRFNDESLFSLTIVPLTAVFPYYEGFESGTNGWTSSPFYKLDKHWKDKAFSAPANGANSWYTSNVNADYPDVRSSLLTSGGFDLSNITNVYLSLSKKSYLRKGRDSALIQISLNRGQSWQNLNSAQSNNWYNSPARSAFTDSNKIYWHSITCRIPDTAKKIMLRVVSTRVDSFKAVTWLGNIGVDDIHLYSMKNEIYTGAKGSGVAKVDSSQWKEFIIDDKIVASIRSNENDPFEVEWNYLSSSKNTEVLNGQKLLNRRWIFKSTKQNTKPALIRLYFNDVDVEWLRSLNACSDCADTVSAYNFNIYHFQGVSININGFKNDNPVSKYQIISSSDFNLIPYGKGYFAEFTAVPTGEFYIQMPERLQEPEIGFRVFLTEKKDARIQWDIADESLVEKYEVERAVGNDNFEANDFNVVSSAQAQNLGSYSTSDKSEISGSPIYYRLKLIYKNGYIRYSPEQVVKLNSAKTILVYPNPSKGIFTIQFHQAAGSQLRLQVSNAVGQLLQSSGRTATGNLDEITVDLSRTSYPPGVYLLKIFNGDQVNSIRLVKQ